MLASFTLRAGNCDYPEPSFTQINWDNVSFLTIIELVYCFPAAALAELKLVALSI